MIQTLKQGKVLAILASAAVGGLLYYYNSQNVLDIILISKLDDLKHLRKHIQRTYKNNKSLVPLNILEIIVINQQGIDFQIKLIQSFASKPTFQDNIKERKDPFGEPYDQDLYVGKIGAEHNLFLNKFPVTKDHLIVTTVKFKKQENQNTDEDLYQTYRAVRAVEGFGFFNSCPDAGASVPHKHLQVLPNEALKESTIIKNIMKTINEQQQNQGQLVTDFRYKLKIFAKINHSIRSIQNLDKQHIYNVYLEILKDISKKDHMTNDSITNIKYNLIMTADFLMIVERSKEKFRDEITLNGVAFTGSILVKNKQQLELLKSVEIIDVLEDVCEPWNSLTEQDSKIIWI